MSIINYEEFLNHKDYVLESTGFHVERDDLNPKLFDFEKDIVRWALAKGKSAVFSDCGTGKTAIQLAWADEVCKHTGGTVLVLAPLSVADQTRREGEKFDIPTYIVEKQEDVIPNAINITNYEKLDHFVTSTFIGVVLDESSILKSFSGKIRNSIIDRFFKTEYRLACTATPAPNDFMEMGNHAEFLGVMRRTEMLSMFFVHDGGQTSKWRLKGHAEDLFWQWMATWAVFLDNPKSLGYEQGGYDLPELRVHEVVADGLEPTNESLSLTERREARKESLDVRSKAVVDICKEIWSRNENEPILIWCDLNAEQDKLESLFGDKALSIRGSTKDEKKIENESRWRNGDVPVLITKPKCCSFGLNWQHCCNEFFVGLSDSYEQYYQAVRRCWRFGQEKPVDVYVVISSKEGCVKQNIERKEIDAKKMQEEMLNYTREITKEELRKTCRMSTPYEANTTMSLPCWVEFAC